MTIILYVVMIAAFIGMFWGNRQFKTRGVPWGRPLAGLFGLVAVGLSIYLLYRSFGPGDAPEIMKRERAFTRIGYETLGDYIGSLYENSTLLIVRQNTASTDPESMDVLIRKAIDTGIAGRLSTYVVTVGSPLDPDDPEAMYMTPDMFTVEQFETILSENVPGYTLYDEDGKERPPIKEGDPSTVVVLSLIGLPLDADETFSLWQKDQRERPRIALANAQLFGLHERLLNGQIQVILEHNPNADFSPKLKLPDSPRQAFEMRYLLVTETNIDTMMTNYPDLFGVEPADMPAAD